MMEDLFGGFWLQTSLEGDGQVYSHAIFGGDPTLCVTGPTGKENLIIQDGDNMK